jgi:hypothetical protein
MRQRLSEAEAEKLAQDLGSLPQLSEETLNDHFRRLFGVEPPARMRRPLLVRAIAYRRQERLWVASSPPRGDCWLASPTMPWHAGPRMWRPSARSSPGRPCCASGMGFTIG